MNRPAWVLLGAVLICSPLLGSRGHSKDILDLEAHISSLDLESQGMKLGIQVVIEGEGAIYSRAPGVPRSTASAIKTAIALDLFVVHGGQLDEVPVGMGPLLQVGSHPAFEGFTAEQLRSARAVLTGRTFWELARIMMGREPADNEVYNAACNLIMIKLGGPAVIEKRLHTLDPAFRGFDLNRYMESWNGDGDNTATPEALVSLYRMASTGFVPGLDRDQVSLLRSLLLDQGEGGPGSVYEKGGTLFPRPMVRVHAGYQERRSGNLVYAVMGEIPEGGAEDQAELFLRLMTAVDNVTEVCRGLESP